MPRLKTRAGIDPLLVGDEGVQLFLFQKLELGDADAVLAGDDAAEPGRQRHDARHHPVGLVQHGVVGGMHRDVGVDVAVARVHVQGDEEA